jgi:uncharacterized protein (TIGR03435 family)
MMRLWTQTAPLLFAVSSAYGQVAPSGVRFEVASIKASDPSVRGSHSNVDRRIMSISNWTAKRLIQRAYGVEDFQVTGGPSWLGTAGFDIQAKVDESEPELRGPEGQQRIQGMLESLLVERFRFQSHKETKVLPIYQLIAGKGGAKLVPAKDASNQSMSSNGSQLTSTGVDMPALAVFLSRTLGRTVRDATGISGAFDFTLQWSQQDVSLRAPAGSEPAGPSIFTALQEQLGLRLESAKGPVEIIVVDHAEKPTDN